MCVYRNLQVEYGRLKQAQIHQRDQVLIQTTAAAMTSSSSPAVGGPHSGGSPTAGTQNGDMDTNCDAEMMAEAKLLRQHKGRLEARMQILEDHNRQLEAQLQRLRQLLDQVGAELTRALYDTMMLVRLFTYLQVMDY